MSERSGKLWVGGIIVVLAGVYLVGNDRVALWDRDEPRYAQTSREMLKSGDWVVPRLLGEVRTAKPVFIYWCQAGAMRVLGDNAFAARLPSVVGVVLTLVVVGAAVGKEVGWERGLWTVVVMGTSALVIAWCARNALTDGMLLLWVTVAQVCLYRVWVRGSATWGDVVVWGVAVGLAGLTKGPVVLAVQGMTGVALGGMRGWDRWREKRRFAVEEDRTHGQDARVTTEVIGSQSSATQTLEYLSIGSRSSNGVVVAIGKVLVGVAIVVVVVGPWLYLVQRRAPEFLRTTITHDVIKRAVTPLEQHTGPPGYYLATIWGTFFPWSLFLPMAVIFGWRHRKEPAVRFALASVLGPWLLFELVQTKLPHYVLPLFPGLAFLTADALVRCFRGEEDDVVRPSFLIGAAVWAVFVLAVGLTPWLVVKWFTPIPLAATVAWSVVAIAYAVGVFALFAAEKPKWAAGAMAGGMAAAMVVALGWYLPAAWFIRLPVRVAEVLRREGASDQVQMIGYKEPSLAFYQGGTIREQREDDFLATHEARQWPGWMVVRGDIWERMPQGVKEKCQVVGEERGWSYADRGRIRNVVVIRKKSPSR